MCSIWHDGFIDRFIEFIDRFIEFIDRFIEFINLFFERLCFQLFDHVRSFCFMNEFKNKHQFSIRKHVGLHIRILTVEN